MILLILVGLFVLALILIPRRNENRSRNKISNKNILKKNLTPNDYLMIAEHLLL
jgi:hypothetical protein